MALPSSGQISLSQVATELGISNAGINLNLASVRSLAGISSGTISLGNLYGKSSISAVSQSVILNVVIKSYDGSLYVIRHSVDFSGFTFTDGSKASSAVTVSAPVTLVITGVSVSTDVTATERTFQVRLTSTTGKTAVVQVTAAIGQRTSPQPANSSTAVTATVVG